MVSLAEWLAAGSLAEWLAAIGTTGALGWAVGSEVRRRRLVRDAPAHRLSAWAEWQRLPEASIAPREWSLYVRNSGDTPAYDVLVRVVRRHSGATLDVRFGVVAPGSTDDWLLTDKQRWPPTGGPLAVELFFQTSDERRWHRDANGSLREIPERRDRRLRLLSEPPAEEFRERQGLDPDVTSET
jgi:hypothetical protein